MTAVRTVEGEGGDAGAILRAFSALTPGARKVPLDVLADGPVGWLGVDDALATSDLFGKAGSGSWDAPRTPTSASRC